MDENDKREVGVRREEGHAEGLAAAIEKKLREEPGPGHGRFRNRQWHNVELRVLLRWEDNPGWVVDRYDVDIR